MKRAARGQSLLETLLAVTIVLVALSLFFSRALIGGVGSAPAAMDALPAFLEHARSVAAGTGDGATVTFVQYPQDGSGREAFDLALYADRPNPGSSFAPVPLRSERFAGAFRASLGPGPLAVFISSSGTASFSQWTVGSPPPQVEPPCSAPLSLVVAGSFEIAQHAPPQPPLGARGGLAWFRLDCDEARLHVL